MKRLATGLILVVFSLCSTAYAKEANYLNLFLTDLKLSPSVDYENIINKYMQAYRSEVWTKYKNDEFELEDKRQESIDMLKDKVAGFDLNDPVVIRTRTEFGEYDFDSQAFEYKPISEGIYFPFRNYPMPNVKLTISNGSDIGDIAMPKAEAKNFLAERKSSYGSIDREVNLTLEIIVESVSDYTLSGKIINYQITADNGDTIASEDLTQS